MPRPKIIDFPSTAADGTALPSRVTLLEIEQDGSLKVACTDGSSFTCDYLQTGAAVTLSCGDTLLATAPDASGRGVVLGRIGPYSSPQPQARLMLEATEVLSLRCGDVTIDLRASDGKLMMRGEDVLLRARGTQRIRAGNVAIN